MKDRLIVLIGLSLLISCKLVDSCKVKVTQTTEVSYFQRQRDSTLFYWNKDSAFQYEVNKWLKNDNDAYALVYKVEDSLKNIPAELYQKAKSEYISHSKGVIYKNQAWFYNAHNQLVKTRKEYPYPKVDILHTRKLDIVYQYDSLGHLTETYLDYFLVGDKIGYHYFFDDKGKIRDSINYQAKTKICMPEALQIASKLHYIPTSPALQIKANTCDGTEWNQWTLTYAGGYYLVIDANTGKLLYWGPGLVRQ